MALSEAALFLRQNVIEKIRYRYKDICTNITPSKTCGNVARILTA